MLLYSFILSALKERYNVTQTHAVYFAVQVCEFDLSVSIL
jgi:hypothetical protein